MITITINDYYGSMLTKKNIVDEKQKLTDMFNNKFKPAEIPNDKKGNYTVSIFKNGKLYINCPYYKINGSETFQKLFSGSMEKDDDIIIYIIYILFEKEILWFVV